MGNLKSKYQVNKDGGSSKEKGGTLTFKGMRKKEAREDEIMASKAGGLQSAAGGRVLSVDTAVRPLDDVNTTDDEALPPGVVEIGPGGEIVPKAKESESMTKESDPIIVKHETNQEKVVSTTEELLQNGQVLETRTEITTKKTVIRMEEDVVNGGEVVGTRKQTVTYESSTDKSADAAALLEALDKAHVAKEQEGVPVEEGVVEKQEAQKPVESAPPLLAEFSQKSTEEMEQERLEKENAHEAEVAAAAAQLEVVNGEVEEKEDTPEVEEEAVMKQDASKPEEIDPVSRYIENHVQASTVTVTHTSPPLNLDGSGEEEVIQAAVISKPSVPEAELLAQFSSRSLEEQESERREQAEAYEREQDSVKAAVELLDDAVAQVEVEEDLPEVEEETIGKVDATKPVESVPSVGIEVEAAAVVAAPIAEEAVNVEAEKEAVDAESAAAEESVPAPVEVTPEEVRTIEEPEPVEPSPKEPVVEPAAEETAAVEPEAGEPAAEEITAEEPVAPEEVSAVEAAPEEPESAEPEPVSEDAPVESAPEEPVPVEPVTKEPAAEEPKKKKVPTATLR